MVWNLAKFKYFLILQIIHVSQNFLFVSYYLQRARWLT